MQLRIEINDYYSINLVTLALFPSTLMVSKLMYNLYIDNTHKKFMLTFFRHFLRDVRNPPHPCSAH